MKKPERATAEARIRTRFLKLKSQLTERARRLFVAGEAMSVGHGGIAAASRATGMAASSIGRGMADVREIESGSVVVLTPTRSRRPGGGRKKTTEKDPKLLPDLKELIESTTRGDPESPLLWTARSQRNIAAALTKQGHQTSMHMVSRLLKELGYSLQANRKRLEGARHPDRNAQFEHINETLRRQLEANQPAISVDTKKKELVGPYKNGGRELSAKGDPVDVNTHDFKDDELGHASPYGVYDLNKNEAWVSVGISHDTGEFAVQTIRTWWKEMGAPRYLNATSLVITADGGGSNGYRLRLWKIELQRLADELTFPITVCHLPPGTSKWNKIEHRLFSFITQNWRGKPLVTHQVIVSLIAATTSGKMPKGHRRGEVQGLRGLPTTSGKMPKGHRRGEVQGLRGLPTTTKTGLRVHSQVDSRVYAKGRRVSDEQLALVHLEPNAFHGEWNYTIHPTGTL